MWRSQRWLVVALLLLAAVPAAPAGAETLVWREEFISLDARRWDHLVSASRGGNSEFQYYRNSRRNSYVRDGVLYIRPTLTAQDYGEKFLYTGQLSHLDCNLSPCETYANKDIVLPIQSARIRTLNSFSFLYGRLEVRAKMPVGDWIWPAIWMKPARQEYGPWPASGEIDVVELRANRNYTTPAGVSQGADTTSSVLHFGPNATYNVWRPAYWAKNLAGIGETFADDFHLFGMVWNETSITFTVDDEIIGSMTPPEGGFWKLGKFDENPGGENIWANGTNLAPFDQEFFIVMNVAVGGKYFPDGWINFPYPRPWNWTSPHPMRDFWERRHDWLPTWCGEDTAMKVDYIRVYQ
ncbi:LOW QUALITY PROTEIN: beta-1,3-glucan-binding protein-like [Bacillus rossius redtenbacheri]|uniref:LOW QUALITY PROTEIN: beta-1,3-glucan-binding protein-like n=1 Tax=Bacillus rossius redtenbacheri TaxID=93214 RepID=UPI002FDCAAAF